MAASSSASAVSCAAADAQLLQAGGIGGGGVEDGRPVEGAPHPGLRTSARPEVEGNSSRSRSMTFGRATIALDHPAERVGRVAAFAGLGGQAEGAAHGVGGEVGRPPVGVGVVEGPVAHHGGDGGLVLGRGEHELVVAGVAPVAAARRPSRRRRGVRGAAASDWSRRQAMRGGPRVDAVGGGVQQGPQGALDVVGGVAGERPRPSRTCVVDGDGGVAAPSEVGRLQPGRPGLDLRWASGRRRSAARRGRAAGRRRCGRRWQRW